MTYIRSLNTIEEAFSISNTVHPLYVVCVLHLDRTPNLNELQKAFTKLQQRHLLLQATLREQNGEWQFHQVEKLEGIDIEKLNRNTSKDWQQAAENGLNTPFTNTSLLMRCIYLADLNEASSKSELLLVFHHSIIDGHGARLLLHELLCLLGQVSLPAAPSKDIEAPQFPSHFSGWQMKKKLLPFVANQMKAEMAYLRKGVKQEMPVKSKNRILSLRFNGRQSRQIMVAAGRKNLSLNSLLSATMLQAVRQEVYPDKRGLMRSISFASLRESMNRPIADDELGCHISMIRFNVPIEGEGDIWKTARFLQQQMYQAGKNGDLYLNAHLSKHLMKMMLRQNFMRLSNTALSYIGPLNLHPQYGDLTLLDVHAFITNNRLGPTFSGFGKILFGQIGLDCNYLESELSHDAAQKIIKNIEQIIIEKCLS